MKNLNRDILVSVIFTFIAYLVVGGIVISGLIGDFGSVTERMLFYGFPFSLLAIFFSRTAVRVEIDEQNATAIQRSFLGALALSVLSLIILIGSLFAG